MKLKQITLTKSLISLVPFILTREFQIEKTAETLTGLINEKEIIKNLATKSPVTKEDEIEFITDCACNWLKNKSACFCITDAEHKTLIDPIGIIELRDINFTDKKADLGYWLAKQCWGKGYMTQAVEAIIEYAFDTLKLGVLHAGVFEGNDASVKVLTKNNFQYAGTLHNNFIKDGVPHHVQLYECLKS